MAAVGLCNGLSVLAMYGALEYGIRDTSRNKVNVPNTHRRRNCDSLQRHLAIRGVVATHPIIRGRVIFVRGSIPASWRLEHRHLGAATSHSRGCDRSVGLDPTSH